MTFDELIAQGIHDTLEEKCDEYRSNGKSTVSLPLTRSCAFVLPAFT